MSEHHFAVTTIKQNKRTVAARNRIAREVGGARCGFVQIDQPSGGTQAWGFGSNLGYPFDQQMAAEIEAAWQAAGVGV